jgi:hypothetical protein
VTLESDLFVGNLTGVQLEAGSTDTLVNNNIDNNSIFGVILDGSTTTLVNNLITNSGNTGVYERDPSSLTLSDNDVFNPAASNGNYSGLADPTSTNGNLAVDPRYFNAADRQYELIPGSPAEDAGTSVVSPGVSAPATDILGNPRFKDPNITGRGDGSGYDMGAFEVQQVATSNIDLATTAVSGPANGIEGETVTVNWTVQEVGSGTATGSWHDAIYLSPSPVLTPDAILLGQVEHTGALGPGASYNGSGTFTLPGVTPGNDYFLVRCNSENEVFEGTNLTNNVAASTSTIAMTLPALTLGSPVTGQLAATGARELYQVTTAAGSDLNVALTAPAGNSNELYVSFGVVPSRQTFDARGVRVGAANQSLSLANTQAGTYYILVYGASVPSPSGESFGLTASTLGFSITSLSPTQGSNTGQVTLSISGAQFDASSHPQLVDAAGVTISPLAVYDTDSGLIAATFDLTGLPTGKADVQVVNRGGVTQTLPHAFDIINGPPGQLVTNLIAPSQVRAGRLYTVTVEYTNTGDTDMPAPTLFLTDTGLSQLSFTPDMSNPTTYLEMVGASATGPAGILPPGSTNSVTVYATAGTTGNESFQLLVGDIEDAPIDWSSVESQIRPAGIPDATWQPIFAQIQSEIGDTWQGYAAAISASTTLLPPSAGLNTSLTDVYNLFLQSTLASVTQSITGQLFLGDTSHPLSNVEIDLTDSAQTMAFSAISRTDGTFVFPELSPGTYNVSFQGFVNTGPTELTVGTGSLSGVQLFAAPGGTISGGVALSGIGEPLSGVVVQAVGADGTEYSTTTDSNGRYAIDTLPAGVYSVTAGGGMYTETTIAGVSLAVGQFQPDVDLAVETGATISGTVTGPAGGVAGALVFAVGASGAAATATTDSTGTYNLAGLPGDTYSVDASAPGLTGAETDGVTVASGASVQAVNFNLAEAGGVSGFVTSLADGSPAALVALTFQSGGNTFGTGTAADGTFSVANMPPGTYTIAAASDQFMSATGTVTVTAGSTASVTLSLAPRGVVSGTVTAAAGGAPVARVIVYAADSSGEVSATVTDSSGNYTLQGFDAGTYHIILGDELSPGSAESTVTLDPADTTATANFSIPVAGTVSGTVFAADGQTPLPGAQVVLEQDQNPILTTQTDASGDYSFVLVRPGAYQIQATADGLIYPLLSGVVVGSGSVLTGQNFTPGLTRTKE